MPSSNPEGDFSALVKQGDRARLSGDYATALDAYRRALDLRDEPVVNGRLGLVLDTLREFDLAAQRLHDAIENPTGISDAEYEVFSRTFKRIRPKVCRVEVSIDQRGAQLDVDGINKAHELVDFWFFVSAAKHTIHVRLDGFEDETREIIAPSDGRVKLVFTMRPLPPPEPPTIALPVVEQAPELPSLWVDKPIPKPIVQPTGRFVGGAGVALVVGATPTPAIGPAIFGAWRSRSWWEVGVDLRAAWAFVDNARFPNSQFVTWSAMVSPCARKRDRWFGCVLLGVDGAKRDDSSEAGYLAGFGLRGGVEFAALQHLRVQAWVDVVAHHRGFRVTDKTPWTSSPISGALGIRGVYTF